MIFRTLVVVAGLAGAVTASQAPELMQQYTQRLGGAANELSRVIERFDTDAASEGLTRQDALARYGASPDRFINRRGVSMRVAVERYERITTLREQLREATLLERPVLLVRHRDRAVFDGTLEDYRPAVPTSVEGAIYAFAGFVAGAAAMGLLLLVFRVVWRWIRPRRPMRPPA